MIALGDIVERKQTGGLAWTGEVMAVFYTRNREVRYVVERTKPTPGALGIYGDWQIRVKEKPHADTIVGEGSAT